jgi:hypothetical protein
MAMQNLQRIVAFHQGYKSDRTIAERIQEFHRGRKPVVSPTVSTAICSKGLPPFASRDLISYWVENDKPEKFPRPWLLELQSAWPGDLKIAAFLSQFLEHLDTDADAKQTQRRMFQPIVSELTSEPLVDLFGEDWKPTLACMQLGTTLTADGAREYVNRVMRFFAGEIEPREIPAALEKGLDRAG